MNDDSRQNPAYRPTPLIKSFRKATAMWFFRHVGRGGFRERLALWSITSRDCMAGCADPVKRFDKSFFAFANPRPLAGLPARGLSHAASYLPFSVVARVSFCRPFLDNRLKALITTYCFDRVFSLVIRYSGIIDNSLWCKEKNLVLGPCLLVLREL